MKTIGEFKVGDRVCCVYLPEFVYFTIVASKGGITVTKDSDEDYTIWDSDNEDWQLYVKPTKIIKLYRGIHEDGKVESHWTTDKDSFNRKTWKYLQTIEVEEEVDAT